MTMLSVRTIGAGASGVNGVPGLASVAALIVSGWPSAPRRVACGPPVALVGTDIGAGQRDQALRVAMPGGGAFAPSGAG